jgi:hypothetical protein
MDAAGAAASLKSYIDESASHLVLRFAGDAERNMEKTLARLRGELAPDKPTIRRTLHSSFCHSSRARRRAGTMTASAWRVARFIIITAMRYQNNIVIDN